MKILVAKILIFLFLSILITSAIIYLAVNHNDGYRILCAAITQVFIYSKTFDFVAWLFKEKKEV